MKQRVTAVIIGAMLCTMLCACSSEPPSGALGNGETAESSVNENAGEDVSLTGSEIVVEYSRTFTELSEPEVVSNGEPEPVSPVKLTEDNGIGPEEAAKLLDKCSAESLYLPQSASYYRKMCVGKVIDGDGEYYEIVCLIDNGGKDPMVGTRYHVASDGSSVLKKSWVNTYEKVKTGTSDQDKTPQQLYPGAKITPNEAILAVAQLPAVQTDLDNDPLSFFYEVNENFKEIDGVEYYAVTPKMMYPDKTTLAHVCLVSADGSGRILIPDPDNTAEYKTVA